MNAFANELQIRSPKSETRLRYTSTNFVLVLQQFRISSTLLVVVTTTSESVRDINQEQCQFSVYTNQWLYHKQVEGRQARQGQPKASGRTRGPRRSRCLYPGTPKPNPPFTILKLAVIKFISCLSRPYNDKYLPT
ncbi:Hypothetical_protein [Hexamita inflata]|uniref:Hypothetical_protein n=1 Tax=Hexamita inflata TaxID=28002 RepID=A0AA86QFE2_9EUKA|nr:Hypothetical protein HINF_LOCUS45320 [Hexamita inflata]